jgi:pyridoxal phosphate enzyme (YggS family)
VLEAIAVAEKKAGRPSGSVKLLPVSKGQTPELLSQALSEGFPARFGENYLEELVAKRAAVAGVEWHYQGRLQSRKIGEIVAHADVVQTVARAKELGILTEESRKQGRKPKFFLQMNVSSEGQKNGADPDDLPALLESVARLGLEGRLLGLMCLPSDLDIAGVDRVRAEFAALRSLRDRHLPRGELSMGMSGDFALAIEEGSDWVRVGTALFGARAPR